MKKLYDITTLCVFAVFLQTAAVLPVAGRVLQLSLPVDHVRSGGAAAVLLPPQRHLRGHLHPRRPPRSAPQSRGPCQG